jgi:hypothetical protein
MRRVRVRRWHVPDTRHIFNPKCHCYIDYSLILSVSKFQIHPSASFVTNKRNTCECVRNLTIVAESHILKNQNGSLPYYHFHKITPFIIFFIDFTVLLDTGWK